MFQIFKEHRSTKTAKLSKATELMEQMDILKNIDKNAPTDILNTTENESFSSSDSSSEHEKSYQSDSSSEKEQKLGKKRKLTHGKATNPRKIKKIC